MLNQVNLIGRITHDLEKKVIVANNQSLSKVDFNLAVNHSKDKVDFINITAFAKLADNICNYLHKGSKIYVDGRISVNKYQDQHQQTKTITKIIAKNIIFLDNKTI